MSTSISAISSTDFEVRYAYYGIEISMKFVQPVKAGVFLSVNRTLLVW